MTRLWLALALAGCYTDFRAGATAPVGHGHGSLAPDFVVSAGGEYTSDRIRAGGGFATGIHAADTGGFVPIALEGRIDMGLGAPTTHGSRWGVTAYTMLGGADGLPNNNGIGGTPDGFLAQGFVGVGFMIPPLNDGRKMTDGALAFGVVATRYQPETGGGFWLIGASLELSFGFDIDKVMDSL